MYGTYSEIVEPCPLGYPQLSTLVGAHPAFSVSRRFSVVRARLLLLKQQRVAVLEKQLKELDLQESRPLYLGSFQADANTPRLQVLKDLDAALADYVDWFDSELDELMKRNTEILQLPQAPQQSVSSLLNWVNSTGSIVRTETAFLYSRDLCAVGGRKDNGIAWIESLIERIFVYIYLSFVQAGLLRPFQHQSPNQVEAESQSPASAAASYSKQIFLFEGFALRIVGHLCITALIVLLMIIPMFIMQAISSATMQIICIMLMSILFTVIVSGPVNARTAEIFGPSATYVTLLAMFLTTTGQR